MYTLDTCNMLEGYLLESRPFFLELDFIDTTSTQEIKSNPGGITLMEDKVLVCKDCGKEFVFSVDEQQFFAEKGFTNEPTRCIDCRRSRRQQNTRNKREYYTVTCSKCGIETQVPFKPNGTKPVYCRDCFNEMKM